MFPLSPKQLGNGNNTIKQNLRGQDLQKRLEAIRQKLFAYREKRVHLYRDDKILTDWNGLMVVVLAKGAQVFDEPQ